MTQSNSDDTRTMVLPDGRTLAFTEHGDPDGVPVIFFHGNPGSRHMRHPDRSIAARMGARVITPDRPGYGRSDFQPRRTLLDMAADVSALADHLGLETFTLLGISAGGPYVAATAFGLPERVRRGAIVSGAAPFDRPDALDDVNDTYRVAYRTARWPAWLLRPMMGMQMRAELDNPEPYWNEVLARANEYDRAVLSRPAVAEQVRAYRPEAVRQGVRGWVHEARLLVKPWGFPLQAVRTEIHLWYWQNDLITPEQMGRYLEKMLPNPVPHFHKGGGHFAWVDHWEDILTTLIAD
ncbi:MAG: alpha/beta fold hydrolase [Chloroflexota bacterium]